MVIQNPVINSSGPAKGATTGNVGGVRVVNNCGGLGQWVLIAKSNYSRG